MRFIRYLIFAAVIIIFLIASMITIISGGENIPVVIATGVLVVIGFPSTTEWVWDKVGPARGFGGSDKQPTSPGTIEDYLNGRLRAFADEEKRFIPLALTLKPAYQEADAEPTDDIEAIFQQNNGHFILLGDPGAGKSTTMRHLMRQAIANYLRYPQANRIPVWINLGEGANPIQPEELLKHWWDNRCYLPGTSDQYIRQHNLLLFLDGLNEMPLDSRSERAKLLREFLEKNPEIQVIVTCRVRDYEDDEALKLSLPSVRVLPLDDIRVQNFIARNGGDTSLWNTIDKDDALRALAVNPYNLYQIIQISREPDGQILPRDLNQLYRRYLKVTYNRYTLDREKKRDQQTPLLKLSFSKLEKCLQHLAFAMLAEGKGTSTDLEWALHWRRCWRWGKQSLRDGLNLGSLVSDGQSLRFYHQSLHGYFAIEPLSRELTMGGGFDRFTKDPIALITQIGDLGTAGEPAIAPLILAIGNTNVPIHECAVEALVKIGEAAIEPLIRVLGDMNDWVRGGAVEALGQIGEAAVAPLIKVLGNTNDSIRRNVVEALGKIGLPAVMPLIKLLGDSDAFIRNGASEALGEIGLPAVTLLIDVLVDTEAEPVVKRTIVDALKIFGKIPERLVILLRSAESSDRSIAAWTLGKIGDAQATEPLIKALGDSEIWVQGNAAVALIRIGTPEARAAAEKWRQENPNEQLPY